MQERQTMTFLVKNMSTSIEILMEEIGLVMTEN